MMRKREGGESEERGRREGGEREERGRRERRERGAEYDEREGMRRIRNVM